MNNRLKFLLLAPASFNLYKLIVKNLEYLGYDVIHVEDEGYIFKYRSLWQRVVNTYRKILFNDGNYKLKLRKDFIRKRQLEIINTRDYFDYVLVIRADFFEEEIIQYVQPKTKNMLSFHYDGIGRDLRILDYVKYFDKFYVFDENDLKVSNENHIKYSPNFYFDFPELLQNSSPNIIWNVYYVSSFHESRVDDLISIFQILNEIYNNVKFVVVCNLHKMHLVPSYVLNEMEIKCEYVSFEDQLSFISTSDVIIDLVISEHNGFSFRILEGIKFGKKVITTNDNVFNADFYHPNNIFVLTKKNHSEVRSFLERPYHVLPNEIVLKYSFTEWLNSKLLN